MVPVVSILSDEEMKRLHTRALEVLERVGIRYESRRCLEILAAAGARVNYDEGIAWLKPDLVERCIKSTPRVITLGARDPKYDFKTDLSRFYIATNGQATFTQDHHTGLRRPGTVQDLRDSTKLAHYLDVIDFVWPTVVPSDVPGPSRAIHEMYHAFAMTTKHIQHELQLPEHVPFALEMLEVLCGDRATLKLNGVSGEALRDWLSEARSAARARAVEVTLTRNPQGYSGTVVVTLGATS